MTDAASKPNKAERIIIGIDPGTHIMGYGVLRVVDNKPHNGGH